MRSFLNFNPGAFGTISCLILIDWLRHLVEEYAVPRSGAGVG